MFSINSFPTGHDILIVIRFGYVEFTNAFDSAKAFEAKRGVDIDGRPINLDYATGRPQGGGQDRTQARARSFGDKPSPESDTLFIGNIPFSANEDSIHELFGPCGSVMGIRLPTDPESGRPKGFGYVQYSSTDEARSAYGQLNGAELDGRPVRLDYSQPRAPGGAGGGRGGGGRGGGRGAPRGGRGGGRGGSSIPNKARGGITDFKGTKMTF